MQETRKTAEYDPWTDNSPFGSGKPTPHKKHLYSKHKFYQTKRAVKRLGNKPIDRRTTTGKALAKWKAELIEDLGGHVSVQQLAIVELVVKNKLLLDSIDSWCLSNRP